MGYRPATMANVVFVAPYALEATARFVDAVAHVPGAQVGLISSDPLEAFPASVRLAAAGHWRIDDCLDADRLAEAVTTMGGHLGSVDRLVAILENLQVPLAQVRERLGIPGMTSDVADRFRDKARMKAAFEAAGVPCARSGRVASRRRRQPLRRPGRLPVRRQAAGRRRRAQHVPRRRRRAAGRMARRRPAASRRTDAPRGVRPRRRALVRQRRGRRPARLALDQSLPAESARRAGAPVDPVVRPAAARHRRPRVRRHRRPRPPRRHRARAADRAVAHGVVPPRRRLAAPSPRWEPARPARSSCR